MSNIVSLRSLCALCLLLAIGCASESSDKGEHTSPLAAPSAGAPVAMNTGNTGIAGSPSSSSASQPPAKMDTTPSVKNEQPMSSDDPAKPADKPASDDAEPAVMDEPKVAWESLITANWNLGPNQERYFCQRTTLKEDVYLGAVRAVNPLGTHHTALTAEPGEPTEPDGLTECNSALDPQGIFGSGVGTNEVFYPDGVGLRLRAGQQLLLNLHIFNVSDEPLSGTSGTEIVKIDPDKVEHVAESVLAGPVSFNLPAGETTKVSGKCTMTLDTTLFAVQPHMHQLGIHMKGVAHSSMAGTVVLHDGDYDFDKQVVYPIDEVPMKKGDTVDIECTFDNTTDKNVSLGESSNAEMCFLVLHRYPAPDAPSVTCFF
jgi:hypothetical protein